MSNVSFSYVSWLTVLAISVCSVKFLTCELFVKVLAQRQTSYVVNCLQIMAKVVTLVLMITNCELLEILLKLPKHRFSQCSHGDFKAFRYASDFPLTLFSVKPMGMSWCWMELSSAQRGMSLPIKRWLPTFHCAATLPLRRYHLDFLELLYGYT